MNTSNFEKLHIKNGTICCELVMKIKQYKNILQFESKRLNILQLECNKLLDQFYSSKHEFDFLIKDSIRIKYLGEGDSSITEEYVKEFSTFFMNIWQMGKLKFSEKGKRSEYICFEGSPLMEVMPTILNFVQEVMVYLTCIPYHVECASTLHNITNQVHATLQEECLGSADVCLRQYVYLQEAIPFLHELKSLIHQYLMIPGIISIKQLVDIVILQIPPISSDTLRENGRDMSVFRFVIDLLNGSLLDNDVLDHSSDIRPVVEDDINLKRSLLVKKAVEWITQQYKTKDVSTIFDNSIYPLAPFEKAEGKMIFHNRSAVNLYSPKISNYPSPVDFMNILDEYDVQRFDLSLSNNNSPYPQRRFSKRGRKARLKNIEITANNDLQPINLDSLQTPLLLPLL